MHQCERDEERMNISETIVLPFSFCSHLHHHPPLICRSTLSRSTHPSVVTHGQSCSASTRTRVCESFACAAIMVPSQTHFIRLPSSHSVTFLLMYPRLTRLLLRAHFQLPLLPTCSRHTSGRMTHTTTSKALYLPSHCTTTQAPVSLPTEIRTITNPANLTADMHRNTLQNLGALPSTSKPQTSASNQTSTPTLIAR